MGDHITVYAWELCCTLGTSDKYYRIALIDRHMLANYGRRDSRGQFLLHRHDTLDGALALVRKATDERVDRGYELTRRVTELHVAPSWVRELATLELGTQRGNTLTEAFSKFFDSFVHASLVQSTLTRKAML